MLTSSNAVPISENPGVGCLLFLLLGCIFFIGWNRDGLQLMALVCADLDEHGDDAEMQEPSQQEMANLLEDMAISPSLT
jgi:hypothetical protein